MGREFELKYASSAQSFEALKARYPQLRPIDMETAYYDTRDRRLGDLRWTLRRRFENGLAVCTLKTPLPDGSRGEWEVPCSDICQAIPALIAAGAPEQLKELTAKGLTQVCAARFTRLCTLVELENATAELALDEGVLLGGGKELPLREVEVELKDGDEESVVFFATELATAFGLTAEPKSKYHRALELARS